MKKGLKILMYVLADLFCVVFAWVFSSMLSGFSVLENSVYIWGILAILLVLISNLLLKIYFIIWQYAGLSSVVRLFITCIIYGIYCVVASMMVKKASIEWAIINTGFLLVSMMGVRYLIRASYGLKNYNKIKTIKIVL